MAKKIKKILITGAAGRIGRYVTQYFSNQYDLLLTDIRQPEHDWGHPFVKCDITDLDGMRALCSQVEMVIHLGANPNQNAPWEELLQPNVIGAYTVFQAAHEGGCRRLIFASSIHAVQGYPDDVQVNSQMAVRPLNLYGATKVWGEALGRYYADQKGLSTICLRIGWVVKKESEQLNLNNKILHMAVTYEDLALLIARCLQAPDDLQFAIFNALSDNRWKRLDISDARESLGYEPQDNAFTIAEAKANRTNDKNSIRNP